MFQKEYKFNSVQVLIICITALFILSACQSDVNDYWKMEEPTLHVKNLESTSFTKISNPTKLDDKTEIGYGSFLKFAEINKDVRFNIQSTCKKENQIFRKQFSSEKIYEKLFLYNYLPPETIAGKLNDESSQEFICDFHFIVVNSVKSEHEFSVNNLKISTLSPHRVIVLRSGEFIHDFDKQTGYLSPNYIDLSNQKDAASSIAMVTDSYYSMKNPKIICNGELKVAYDKDHVTKDFIFQKYLNTPEFNLVHFLKKCRVIATTSYASNSNIETTGSEKDSEVVWSPYFDVVFEKPQLEINAEIIHNADYYTDNDQTFTYRFAKLHIKNVGNASAIIKLNTEPFESKVEILSDYFMPPLINQAFHPAAFTNSQLKHLGFPTSITNNSISVMTKLDTDTNSDYINLDSGAEHIVYIDIQKNFSCSFFKKRELGFWIQGMATKSLVDKVDVFVRSGPDIEAYPIEYFMSDSIVGNSTLNPGNDGLHSLNTIVIPRPKSVSYRNKEAYNDFYLGRIGQAIKATNSKNIRQHKNSLQKLGSTKNHCRVFPL